ncbi:MAG: hypothetical protein U9N01_04600 [Euryarchaeota archaeon]|nr:hypothetical protein [Euryarchaeota archaeon]
MADKEERRKMSEELEEKKEKVSPYRLTLKPREEQRRQEWNLIFISDHEVTVDFYHTDMLERVVLIQKRIEKKEGDGE